MTSAMIGAGLLALAVSAGESTSPTLSIRFEREPSAVQGLTLEVGQNRLILLSEEIARVAVADPSVADLKVITPTQVLLTAKGPGATDLTLWNRDNRPIVMALQVSRNMDALRRQLRELFPGENISVSVAGDLVVLTGEVSDLRVPERAVEVAKLHAKQVANLVKVAGNQQVQLEVRFAEVTRSGLREIGLNAFQKTRNGRYVSGLFGSRTLPGEFLNSTSNPAIPGTGPAGGVAAGQPPDVPAPQFQNAFSLFFSGYPSFPFSAMLNLLESNGLAKVLAEPTLVTLSGQEARFLAGGEIPIPVASALGQINVEWKRFGIILRFTPTVLGEGTIHLKLAAEVSDLDPTSSVTIAGTTIPGLTSRQSEVTVRMGDGESFAVAGLLSDRVRSQIDKVPWLGSIPIIGALFRSSTYSRQESELLVVVTAHLAQPVAPEQVPPLPTDRAGLEPGNFEYFLLGSDASGGLGQRGGPSGERGFSTR
ncbi:MAG TPA: type II and III secretion system protein family protein [Anaeromyxobacter sp.]|nr:type II and III secretion system protein family protein [Anaeromyxobacter sp.]